MFNQYQGGPSIRGVYTEKTSMNTLIISRRQKITWWLYLSEFYSNAQTCSWYHEMRKGISLKQV